ncbi:MAG TPA: BtuF-related (seleno)protein [Candidatus Nitrosopolaris sp.]|nr:BtuF-related (seleno)protein [Candidatus Nitrosopolaris sp.]
MRIVSLLPSATESLFALGLGSSVVAVTHECDYPQEASSLPIVTRSTLQLRDRDSAGIETAVSEAAMAGRSLYFVDTQAVRDLEPDLVVAQDVCRVCAVSADQVAVDLEGIRIIRQHPHSLQNVLADIVALARACGADATPLMSRLTARIEGARRTARRHRPVRGVFLEWLDPPYPAGHWTPDLLELAGIDDPLARAGLPSLPIRWDDVVEARPDLLLLAPCGFDKDRADREAAALAPLIEATGAGRVVVFDGSAYFNRPGPRLIDSLELLAQAAGEP